MRKDSLDETFINQCINNLKRGCKEYIYSNAQLKLIKKRLEPYGDLIVEDKEWYYLLTFKKHKKVITKDKKIIQGKKLSVRIFKNDELIKEFESINEAYLYLFNQGIEISKFKIRESIYFGIKYGEYRFENKDIKPIPKSKVKTKIVQYDLKGNIIATYSSIPEALAKTKVCRTALYYVLNGTRATAGGYVWDKVINDE